MGMGMGGQAGFDAGKEENLKFKNVVQLIQYDYSQYCINSVI